MYYLVTQGILVGETQDKEEAIREAVKNNISWMKYKQKCLDRGEDYADNEMFVYDGEEPVDLTEYYGKYKRSGRKAHRGEPR